MDANNTTRRHLTEGPVAYSRPPARPFRRLRPLEIPAPGAHLITPWLGFAHHGIYVGEGRVIHYGALVYDIIRKPVEEVSLETFSGGRPVFVVQHESLPFDVSEIIGRARSRLGESRYRLLTNNCEHFVEWCLYDEHRSFQVERALEFPRFMGERIQSGLLRFAVRLLSVFRRQAVTTTRIQPPKH
jgi:Lecithin retinol acyltransferase